ncbi:MAG: 3-isopropylmalate dehydratase small subunit, partial [Burkholderia sp.]|nr:3-isopropylmalate dehydratase small subunit [Burkholderia sp.]
VIAPSFAEIFYSNAMNNRLLLVQLERDAIDALTHEASETAGTLLSIDLERQTVTSGSGHRFDYAIGARHKRMVIDGMDTVDLTLDSLAAIEAFEQRHFARHPWAQVM